MRKIKRKSAKRASEPQRQPLVAEEEGELVYPLPTEVPVYELKSGSDGKIKLTPQEVSVLLNRTVNALEHMRRSGKGPAFFKEGGKVFYYDHDVQKYID